MRTIKFIPIVPESFNPIPNKTFGELKPQIEEPEVLKVRREFIQKHRAQLPFKKFLLIYRSCRAAYNLVEKGKLLQLSHDEGFTLLSWLMPFEEGVERFEKRMIGWGKSERDRVQIRHFVEKGYSPYTCAKAQSNGTCPFAFDENCLRARFTNGVRTSPSPIRFAYGAKGLDVIIKEAVRG